MEKATTTAAVTVPAVTDGSKSGDITEISPIEAEAEALKRAFARIDFLVTQDILTVAEGHRQRKDLVDRFCFAPLRGLTLTRANDREATRRGCSEVGKHPAGGFDGQAGDIEVGRTDDRGTEGEGERDLETVDNQVKKDGKDGNDGKEGASMKGGDQENGGMPSHDTSSQMHSGYGDGAAKDSIHAKDIVGNTPQEKREDPICRQMGCIKGASFAYEGLKPQFCFTHRLRGMTGLQSHCILEDCHRQAYYNFKGEKRAIYCSTHKQLGMLNVRHRLCEGAECPVTPTFSFADEKPRFCAAHKEPGMVDNKSRTCEHMVDGKRCKHSRIYGLEDGKAKYCKKHKTDGMINIKNKRVQERDRERKEEAKRLKILKN
ncbi:unnamed protein product [Choristocarpus tenellus]